MPKTLPRTPQDLPKTTKNRPKTARRWSQSVFFVLSVFLLSVLLFHFSLVSSPFCVFLLSSLFVLLSSVLSLLFLSSPFALVSFLSSVFSLLFSSLPLLPNCGGELPYWSPLPSPSGLVGTWHRLTFILFFSTQLDPALAEIFDFGPRLSRPC